MADNQYKVELGINLNTSDLKSEVAKLDDKYKVKIGVDLGVDDIRKRISAYNKNTNNAKLHLKISLDTDDLKRQINKLDLTGKGIAIPVNTESLKDAFNEVKSAITEIKNSLGTLDDKANTKSLVAAVNQIANALEKATSEFNGLVASLNALSKKDFSFNLNLKTGNANPIKAMTDYGQTARRETIPALQEQVNYLKKLLGGTDEADKALEKYLVKLHKGFEGVSAKKRLESEMVGVGSDGKSISDIKRMSAYEQYVDYLKQIASLNGIKLDGFNAQFSKAASEMVDDTVKIQSGVKETEEQFERLKSIFNTGIDADGLGQVLQPLLDDTKAIRETIEGFSKGISIDSITNSFREMSETLEVLTQNLTAFKNAFGNIGNGLNGSVGNGTGDKLANDINSSMESVQANATVTSGVIENLKSTLQTMRLDKSSIDAIISDVEKLGFAVTDASVKMKNGNFDITVNGVDSIGRAVTEIRHLDSATDEISGVSRKISQTFKESDVFIKQQKNAVSDLTNTINQLNRATNDQNAARPIKDTSHLESLESQYKEVISAIQRMENASDDNTFQEERNNVKKLISEYKSLTAEYKNAENTATSLRSKDIDTAKSTYSSKLDVLISEMKNKGVYTSGFEKGAENLRSILSGATDTSGLNKFSNGLDKLEAGYKRADAAAKEFNRSQKVGINVSGLESKIADIQRISPEIDQFKTKVNGAEVTVESLIKDLKNVKTQGDFSVVNSRFKAFTDAAKAAGIAVTEVATKVKSVNDIKLDIKLGNYDNQISQMDDRFNSLSYASDELYDSVTQVHSAYEALESALQNTGDEVADRERLIQAEKEYAEALERTNNLLKIQAREEKRNVNKEKLDDDIKLFQSEIDAWLVKNSAATRKFSGTMLDLKAKAEGVDRVTLNGLARQFKLVDKEAEKLGLKTLSVFDRFKNKFKEYMSYLSAAEIFMWAEQGLRDMFEQVKLIDSAMTELKKVTDETDAAYSQFLSNAADKAKEIGTTIDGLVSSTADFARLGYGFKESQGLAEVANIYAVVGDDIENVESATQSLISTLTAFKNEANGLSDSDFALNIVDKMNEVSNNFAISSGGIGDALQRSASSMMAANNSLDETIALITAANTVVQDPEQIGTAFKTISMRIRGAKTELEEAGLETEGMVESTSKLRSEIKALTGVDIMDGANQFKSTYQIMDELADKWQNLSDIQQATVTEIIAGKRQGNIVSSLMNNFDIAENALNTSLNSSGSAMKEHEKYMDSIEAKLSQLKASWQSFAQTFMDSNFLKGGIDALSGFVDILEKLVDNFGVLGTIGFGSAIFGLFKNRNNFSGILSSLSAFGQLASEAWHSSGKLTTRFKDIGKAAGMAGGDIVKSLTGSLSGMIGVIGLVTAAIGLAYNAYKKVKEEVAANRQEVIESSDAYLDAASSFEKAYIKYSDKTDLTESEEEELKTAIQGTIDALGDKSGAIQGAINSNNDYLASLEAIKKAELDAARRAAEDKRDNAKESLKEAAIGYESWDGSEVDINLGKSTNSSLLSESAKIAKNIGRKYFNVTSSGKDNVRSEFALTLSPDADVNEIIDYYYTLLKIQEKLKDQKLDNTDEYNAITSAIDKMSDSIGVYTDGVYEAVKANYQLSQGIPKTAEEYVQMRESILNDKDLDGFSFDKKLSIANTLDSEYGQLFDLSSAEIQARKFVGLIKGYGDGTKDGTDEIGAIETFINMRTAVNNDECTVGDYLSQFDEIDKLTKGWSEEEKKALNTSFGLDTDAIKEQYKDVYNYLSRNYLNKDTRNMDRDEEYYYRLDVKEYQKQIKEFLGGLSASELDAVVDIKTEIDWENTSLEDIQKQIQEQVKLNEALNFDADIEIDTTALEALNDILAESASAIGLSEESIDSLKSKYKDLDGYNPHTLFEKTANGVKVNRRELAKLEKKYNDLTKTEVQEHLDTLVEEYNKCTKAIDGNIDSNKKLELISKREKYAQQIEELAEYQAQLEGVTGAYERWLNAQETPEDYEGYEKVATSREDIKDEISRGFLSNSTKEYIDLLSGEDLVGGTIDDYADAWARLDKKVGSTSYSIHDFFTVNDDGDITSTGIDRFFKGIQKDFKGEVYKFNEDTQEWYYDFSAENLKKIQDEWGIGIEAIELLLEAAASAGYDIDWGGIFDDLEIDTSNFEDVEAMITLAEKAQEEFNKIKGVEDVEFNFRANNIEEATTEVEKARKAYLDLITNKDGSINLKAEGAEQMQFMLSTLLTQKQRLSTPAIMKVDTSQIDKAETDIIDVIDKAKALQTAYEKYEIAITTGVDVEGAKKDLNSAIEGMKGTSVDVRADLKLPSNDELEAAKNGIGDIKIGASLDDTSIGAIATKIQTECTPEVIAKVTGLDETAIQDGSQQVVYTAEHSDVDNFINSLTDISKKIIYEYTTEGTKPNPSNINRSIIYKYKTEGDVPEVNGTANANGTAQSGRAFARGNWGIKGSGTALVGELGMETLVRGGHFYTIGDNGAEFIKYKQGDIIFNHKQTEELFKNGKVTSDGGRGKMFANGSAYADGSHDGEAFAWGASASPSKFATTKIKDDGGTPKVKAETKTKVTKKNDGVEVNNEINLQPNISAKASDKSNSLNEVTKKEEEKAKNENKFEEAIDWIEIILDRAERAIDKYEQQSNNVYKTWAKRNKALENEINQVSSTISLYEKAKNQYLSEANSVGLSESYASKVRNGSLSVEDFNGESDEKLVKKIKNYQDLYDKYLNCVDKINELKEQEASLYSQRFENVQSEYDNLLQGFDHTESMLNEYISQAEEKGYIVSKNYYGALIDNEEDRISTLKQEQSALIKARDEAVANGEFDKYSEDWYKMCASIDEVTQAIESGTTSIIEYQNAIRDIDFEVFELIQERISDITAESDFLIELMSNKKLFSDKGNLTSQGFATMALHGQNYNSYMYQADDYGAEVAKLDKQIAKDPYDKELIDKRREYIELQREMILNAEEEKNAIKDLVSEGIELQLDSLSELIDRYNDALDSQKDLYDYQKRVEEQTKEISSLQKQLSAYEGDNSEEARAKIQELRVSLEEAESNLQETEYDKFISDQSALLDNLFLEAETIFNERIDNTDALVTEVIDGINAAANNLSIGNDNILSTLIGTESTLEGALDADVTNIQSTLTSEAEKVGATLSNAMNSIWSVGDGSIKSVLSMYGNNFQNKQTTTNSTLSRIEVSVNSMLSSLNKEAEKKVTANKTSSSDKKNPTTKAAETVKNLSNKTTNTNNKKPALTDSKLKGIAAAIWVYGSKAGWEDDPTRKNKLTAKLGAENAKKVQGYINELGANGGLYKYWTSNNLKLDNYKYSAFKLGAKNVDETQLAWTQEQGREYIVRPSDGAILTPVAKGDSVLTSAATNNIWQMANSPAEFIKDNLNLGTTSVPNNSTIQNGYNQTIESVVFSMPNVRNYDELITQMQRDPNFERLVEAMSIGKLAGKSSLSKGKAIR